jgi:hypothetical protein
MLLQNQGNLRVQLRGHVLLCDHAISQRDGSGSFVFADEAIIPPGAYVLLHSGIGISKWARTRDGALVFHTFMDRESPYWLHESGPIHVLSAHHTFVERGATQLIA